MSGGKFTSLITTDGLPFCSTRFTMEGFIGTHPIILLGTVLSQNNGNELLMHTERI